MSSDHASDATTPKKRALRCATAGSVDDTRAIPFIPGPRSPPAW